MSDSPDPLTVVATRSRRTTVVTLAAATLGPTAAILLLIVGRERSLWGLIAGVLVLGCIGVCSWAAISAERDINQITEAVQRFTSERAKRLEPRGEDTDAT